LIAYLIGSIPFGFIIAKVVKGIDIRNYGSKNIGATNVGRILGTHYFFVVSLLDFLKGFIPVYHFASQIGHAGCKEIIIILTVLTGMCTLLGHIFPIYLGFKGGKGVATGVGVIFAINYIAGLIGLVAWLTTLIIFRYVSLASIISICTVSVFLTIYDKDAFTDHLLITLFMILLAFIIILRHISNISRILDGTENRIIWQKKLQ
jgi:glycerol-3-phosphate acyltransferase PlsY